MSTENNAPTPITDSLADHCKASTWQVGYGLMEAMARTMERELTAAKKAYLDVADAVCRESTGPEDVCRQARETRKQLEDMTDQFFAVSQENAAMQQRIAELSAAQGATEGRGKWVDA